MSKIEELKKKVAQDGMTDDDFEQFKILLRRTPGDFSKHQHCYTTAASLPKENSEQAIKLIQYGLENFANNDWLGKYWAYSNLADIYLRQGNISKHIRHYKKM